MLVGELTVLVEGEGEIEVAGGVEGDAEGEAGRPLRRRDGLELDARLLGTGAVGSRMKRRAGAAKPPRCKAVRSHGKVVGGGHGDERPPASWRSLRAKRQRPPASAHRASLLSVHYPVSLFLPFPYLLERPSFFRSGPTQTGAAHFTPWPTSKLSRDGLIRRHRGLLAQ